MDDFQTKSWYNGTITREGAEATLKTMYRGAFMVRPSSKVRTLCVRTLQRAARE